MVIILVVGSFFAIGLVKSKEHAFNEMLDRRFSRLVAAKNQIEAIADFNGLVPEFAKGK